jgi:hypothetical protein
MTYIENLDAALKKREDKIKYTITYCSSVDYSEIKLKIGIDFPPKVKQYFDRIEHIKIESPRQFEILPLNKICLFDAQFLFFSVINNEEKICFDISHINDADQWDIINFSNKYLITKTISSYLINKIWAWVDRDRMIWQEEFYSS